MYKILIVDDEKWIRKGIIAKLRHLGFEFSWIGESENGAEAVELIREQTPQIVITDVRMPVMDGIQMIKNLREAGWDIKTIIISGYADFHYAEQALNLGVWGYILKPIAEGNLRETLEKVMARLDEEKELQTQNKRSEIAKEYTWNLESIFATNDDWKQEFEALSKEVPHLEELKGKLAESGKALFEVLQARDAVFERLEKLFVYTSMRKDEDTTNSTYQGMYDQAMQLYVQATTAISFIEPEILALSQEKQDQFVQEYPELRLYDHQLHDLSRNRPHIRSAEVEATLSRLKAKVGTAAPAPAAS